MMITAVSMPLAILFVKVMKVWGARPARIALLLFAATVLCGASLFLQPGDSTLLFNIFIFIPSVFGVMFASLRLLVSVIFETTPKSQAARVIGKMGASALAGAMIGGLIAKFAGQLLEPKWLIFLGALMILCVAVLVIQTHRTFPTNLVAKKAEDGKSAGYFASLNKPYASTLLFIAMAGAFAGMLIDVQFYISASSAGMDSKGGANFYIMLSFGSLLVRFLSHQRFKTRLA